MDKHIRRRVAIAAAGTAIAVAALITAPQAVTAAPLAGAAGMERAIATGNGAAYLEIDGLDPAMTTSDPSAPNHRSDIVLRSMDWSASNSSTFTGGGGGAGKVSIAEFTVVKQLDQYTPQLFVDVATGKHLTSARIYLVRTDAKGVQLEAMQYDLTDVLVVGDAHSTDGSGSETLKLAASRIKLTHYAGTTATSVGGWDTKTNTKV